MVLQKKYKCKILVYYKLFETMESAIIEEKRIKAGSRIDKVKVIEEENKFWNDLYSKILS
jgi:putative endonuclease